MSTSISLGRVARHVLAGIGMLAVLGLQTGCKTINLQGEDFLNPDAKRLSRGQKVPARELDKLQLGLAERHVEPIELRQPDGTLLRGVFVGAPGARATVLMYGNNEYRVAVSALSMLQTLKPLNVNFLVFDYRGYGLSEGVPTLDLVNADALAVFDYARKRVTGPLIVHGHSFGSFVASGVASQRPVDGLVLEGTSPSVQEFAKGLTPWYAKPFVTVNIEARLIAYDNGKALGGFSKPLLVLQGEEDKVTRSAPARALYESVPSAHKLFREVPAADHMGAMKDPAGALAYAELLALVVAQTKP